jgi:hypothetical protein
MEQEIDFSTLNLPIQEYIKNYSLEEKREIFTYLNEMDETHRIAYKIAFEHLETSFNILKSNGYKEWKMNGK